jgi:hypothetical protein
MSTRKFANAHQGAYGGLLTRFYCEMKISNLQ